MKYNHQLSLALSQLHSGPRYLPLTRHSSPVSLSQSTKKVKREAVNEEDEALQEPKSNRSSLRPNRGKLWDHPEQELPLLTSPLEVDSETPVADALIRRLQDEEEEEEEGTLEMVCTLKTQKFRIFSAIQKFDDINRRVPVEQLRRTW